MYCCKDIWLLVEIVLWCLLKYLGKISPKSVPAWYGYVLMFLLSVVISLLFDLLSEFWSYHGDTGDSMIHLGVCWLSHMLRHYAREQEIPPHQKEWIFESLPVVCWCCRSKEVTGPSLPATCLPLVGAFVPSTLCGPKGWLLTAEGGWKSGLPIHPLLTETGLQAIGFSIVLPSVRQRLSSILLPLPTALARGAACLLLVLLVVSFRKEASGSRPILSLLGPDSFCSIQPSLDFESLPALVLCTGF